MGPAFLNPPHPSSPISQTLDLLVIHLHNPTLFPQSSVPTFNPLHPVAPDYAPTSPWGKHDYCIVDESQVCILFLCLGRVTILYWVKAAGPCLTSPLFSWICSLSSLMTYMHGNTITSGRGSQG